MIRLPFIKLSCLLLFVIIVSPSSAWANEKNKKDEKRCVLVKPKKMAEMYSNEKNRLKNIFIFDIRPYKQAIKSKQIQSSRMISYQDLEKASMNKIKWEGKSVYLVGEDTESTVNFCNVMIKKDFTDSDIHVLEGGISTWNGPLMGNYNEVFCKEIRYRELIDVVDSGRKIEVVDLRIRDNYDNGHIPSAKRADIINQNRLYLNERSAYWADLRDQNGMILFIGDNEQHAMRRCRSAKRGSGLDILYVLKGNMKGWEGPVEKEHLEIWKRKIKDLLKARELGKK